MYYKIRKYFVKIYFNFLIKIQYKNCFILFKTPQIYKSKKSQSLLIRKAVIMDGCVHDDFRKKKTYIKQLQNLRLDKNRQSRPCS